MNKSKYVVSALASVAIGSGGWYFAGSALADGGVHPSEQPILPPSGRVVSHPAPHGDRQVEPQKTMVLCVNIDGVVTPFEVAIESRRETADNGAPIDVVRPVLSAELQELIATTERLPVRGPIPEECGPS